MIAWTLRTLWTHLGRPLDGKPKYRTRRITTGRLVATHDGAGKDEQTMSTGIITTLWDRGAGSILPAAGPRRPVDFDRAAVAPGGFARLRLGQVVAFDEEADPADHARPRAIQVTPLAVAGYPVTPGTP